jgi:hypothetical protein
MKRYKLLGTDHILVEFIEAESNTLGSEVRKLIIYVWNKEKLPEQ